LIFSFLFLFLQDCREGIWRAGFIRGEDFWWPLDEAWICVRAGFGFSVAGLRMLEFDWLKHEGADRVD